MTELLASDAAYSLRDGSTSTYADNGISYSGFNLFAIFLLWPVHSEKTKERKCISY